MIRVGLGYDSHRFEPPGPLTLGGIRIPYELHLHGHSDGDAVCHALTDALLGATGGGDIGDLFPDTDAINKGRNSVEMLEIAVRGAAERGYRIVQADITVVTETPRLAPHKSAIRSRVASALGLAEADVSVKAKTNEGLGWIGRGEGLACMAVVLVARAT